MNEEVNFCSQCGATVSPYQNFCSYCGYDLQNSSTKTSFDPNIKLETTNATLEKGVKATGAGLEAIRKGLLFSMGYCGYILTPLIKIIKKSIKLIVKILTLGAILYGIALIGFMLQESYLKKALQEKLKIETAQGKPIVQSEWKVFGSDDPASEKKIGTSALISSSRGLCVMDVEHRIDGTRLTSFRCDFEFKPRPFINIKFDNDHNIYTMRLSNFKGHNYKAADSAYVEPSIPVNYSGNIRPCEYSGDCPEPLFSYGGFINGLISAKTVAIKLTPTISAGNFERLYLDSVWIRFTLKGAKEAIDTLGKEFEAAPNISND